MRKVGGLWFPDNDAYISKVYADGAEWQMDRLRAAISYVERPEEMVAIDAGAHVGEWTVRMAEAFKHTVALEPAADAYECLERNLWPERQLGKVDIKNAAVGSKDMRRVRVAYDHKRERAGNTGSRYVEPDEEGDVRVVTIDELDYPMVGLIKLDVEGAECAALEGAMDTLKIWRPVVFAEVKGNMTNRFGHEGRCVFDMMDRLGARCVESFNCDHVFVFK